MQIYKELYVQAQNWARHNEILIISSNTILATAGFTFLSAGISIKNDSNFFHWISLAVSLIGTALSLILSNRFHASLRRVIIYEKKFKLHQPTENSFIESIGKIDVKWGDCWVPKYLHNPPRIGLTTPILFLIIYFFLTASNISKLRDNEALGTLFSTFF